MAVNPIQKEKNSATIVGAIIGMIMGIIITFGVGMLLVPDLLGSLSGKSGEKMVTAVVLNKDIKSGTKITQNDFKEIQVKAATIPSDYVNTSVAGHAAKIDLAAGTVLSASMFATSADENTNDVRQQEYNMLALPTKLQVGDFVDIRLLLPTGQDFIVVSKKQVINCNETTIWMNLNEEETLIMSNAIIEHYIMSDSKLYATKYTNPGTQNAAVPTYTPNSAVVRLINGNANVSTKDGEGRYSVSLKEIRNNVIERELSKYEDVELKNIETKIEEEIKNLKTERAKYITNLNAAG